MKKALSLILALVLCFGLCACGSNNGSTNTGAVGSPKETESTNSFNLYQEWKNIYTRESIIFNEDGTCAPSWFRATAKFEYKSDLHMVIVYTNQTINFDVVCEDDIYILRRGSEDWVPAEYYDGLHAQHITKTKAEACEGRTELQFNTPYISTSGYEISFYDIEITVADNNIPDLNLYFTAKNVSKVSDLAQSRSPEFKDCFYFTSGYSPEACGVVNHIEDDRFMLVFSTMHAANSMDELKEEVKDLMYLTFSIGDGKYYIDVSQHLPE